MTLLAGDYFIQVPNPLYYLNFMISHRSSVKTIFMDPKVQLFFLKVQFEKLNFQIY